MFIWTPGKHALIYRVAVGKAKSSGHVFAASSSNGGQPVLTREWLFANILSNVYLLRMGRGSPQGTAVYSSAYMALSFLLLNSERYG